MPLLFALLEAGIVLLAGWVAVFELVLYARLPYFWLQVLAPALLLVLLVVFGPGWWRRIRGTERAELLFSFRVGLVGGLLCVLFLVASRSDSDDFGYLRPALLDALSPEEPITWERWKLPYSGRPVFIPELSRNGAYEPLVVLLAHGLGLDVLSAYHNVFPLLAVLAWTAVYALLLRTLAGPGRWVWFGLGAAILLLLLDGNVHRSFGNLWLLRLWQGKIMVWAIFVPLFVLDSMLFLREPSGRGFARLMLIGLVGMCFNRSAVFLFPVLVVSLSAASLLSFGWTERRLRRGAVLVITMAPLVIFGGIVLLWGVLRSEALIALWWRDLFAPAVPGPSVSGPEALSVGFYEAPWLKNLQKMLLDNPLILARNFLFFFAVPFLTLKRPYRLFLPALSLILLLVCFVPPLAPLWFDVLTDKGYWRFAVLLPLPLCFSLLPLLLARLKDRSRRGRWAALATFIALAVLTGFGLEKTVLSPDNRVALKSPGEYRFARDALEFSRLVAPQLEGKRVLACNRLSWILSLTHLESIDLVFRRIERQPPSVASRADRVLSLCRARREDLDAVALAVAWNVEVIVMSECDDELMKRLRKRLRGVRLEETVRAHGFRMLSVVRSK